MQKDHAWREDSMVGLTEENDGFSLVELIVSMLVSMLVISSVVLFITVAMNFYRSTNEELKLQMESQIAMNLIADIVIETKSDVIMNYITIDGYNYPVLDINTGVFDSVSATTINYHHIIVYDSNTNRLLYDKYQETAGVTFVLEDEVRNNILGEGNLKKVFLADYVTGLNVTQSGALIQITIDFANGDNTYHATQNINMRNSSE